MATTTAVEETKADKFKRLGNARLGKALAAISSIGGLANKVSYEYTPDQVEKIGKALEAEVVKVIGKLSNPDAKVAPATSIL